MRIQLRVAAGAVSIPEDVMEEVFEATYNGLEVYPVCDEYPMPWDAGIGITGDGKEVELVGGVGAGGFGRCVVAVPVEKFNDCYRVEMETHGGTPIDSLILKLAGYGWVKRAY